HADVGALMHRAHLVMTPSVTTASGDRESGVIVLKEAAATGLPTIGTRHGGIPEIIEHERTGLLVEERDEAQLADALARILSRPDLQDRKSTRLNSSHVKISYAVFCLKKTKPNPQ